MPGAPTALRRLMRLLDDPARFAPGGRLPAARVLARELQLSHTTVCGLLDELERIGLTQRSSPRIRLLAGPGRAARAPRARVAVLTGRPAAGHLPVAGRADLLAEVHGALWRRLREDGHDVLTVEAEGDPVAALNGVDVAVLLEDATRLAPALGQPGGPALVLQADALPDPWRCGGDAVISDHAAGCAELVRHLAATGRRRLVRLHMPRGDRRLWWCDARQQGYLDGCRSGGLAPLPPLILPWGGCLAREVPLADAFRIHTLLITELLRPALAGRQRPDALLLDSDGVVPPVMAALRRLGLAPGLDVAVAGYDHYWRLTREAAWEPTPPAASIDRDSPAIAAAIADQVRRRLQHPGAPRQVVRVPPRLARPGRLRRTHRIPL